MKIPAALKTIEGQYVVLGLVALVVVYYVGKKVVGAAGAAAGAAVDTAGGLLSGNNALTQGTPYQGAGLAGTLGAAANTVSGGALSSIGETIGGWLADLTIPDPNATPPAANREQVVTPNFVSDVDDLGGSWQ